MVKADLRRSALQKEAADMADLRRSALPQGLQAFRVGPDDQVADVGVE